MNKFSEMFNSLKNIRKNINSDKDIGFKEQIYIMTVFLFVSCLLFMVVYLIYSFRVDSSTYVDLSQTEISVEASENIEASNFYEEESAVAVDEESVIEASEQSDEESVSSGLDLTSNVEYVGKYYEDIYSGELILVNRYYSCHSDGENTVQVLANKSGSYAVTDNKVYANADIMDNINNMFDDFAAVYGSTDIMIACAYRSYETQAKLYNEEILEKGSESEASKWVAPPGFSEHQTGYAFDTNLNIQNASSGIQYDGTGIYSWINQNCYKYGFILRYPLGKEDITGYEYEPWHFRYVGVAHATYIMSNEITLEEYIDEVQSHSIEAPLEINGDNGQKWLVYYVEAQSGITRIPVLSDYEYSISGDNFSGFIVTVQVK